MPEFRAPKSARNPPLPVSALVADVAGSPAAAQHYAIALADWIDLSGAINPHPYPVPPIDSACWNELPEDDDGLAAAAAKFYGNDRLLVVAGAQAAIRALPALFRPAVVACLTPIADAQTAPWVRAGHQLRRLPTIERVLAAATPNVLLANRNPLTGALVPRATLLDAAARLERRGGWLIVDESLADADRENCIAALAGSGLAPNLLVIRSLVPFFGLAGARVGFVFGAGEKLDGLREMLGPWPVTKPSRVVARHALTDGSWQAKTRAALAINAQRLADLLAPLGTTQAGTLFCSVQSCAADALFEHFAARAILTRRFSENGLLRFALPGREAGWQRLTAAVLQWKPPV